MGFQQHPQALVETDAVGDGSRVGAFAHVAAGARIGRDTEISGHAVVGAGAVVGDRVAVEPGCVILPGVTVGSHAMVGAGAVVTRDVPPYAIVAGNPAQITGYVSSTFPLTGTGGGPAPAATPDVGVGGVQLLRLPEFEDMRGRLTVAETPGGLPFEPRRFFLVYGVPGPEVRGEHAHRTLHQLLLCVSGECAVVVDDGTSRAEITLDSPTRALHIPPMVWGTQYKFTADACLLVLASDVYDPDDYIRDYDEFRRAVGGAA